MQGLQMQLLDILREDCRIPLEKLAVMTGSTLKDVAAAIEDMEKRHVILRYPPAFNWLMPDGYGWRP